MCASILPVHIRCISLKAEPACRLRGSGCAGSTGGQVRTIVGVIVEMPSRCSIEERLVRPADASTIGCCRKIGSSLSISFEYYPNPCGQVVMGAFTA